jgi:hypothetical protein
VKKYRFTDVGVADEQDGVGRRAKCGQRSVHGQWISGVAKWPAGAEPAINVRLSKAACDDLSQGFAIAGGVIAAGEQVKRICTLMMALR